MKFHKYYVSSLIRRDDDSALLVGIAGGRVGSYPKAKWLYSIRLFLLFFRVEILWTTGETDDSTVTL